MSLNIDKFSTISFYLKKNSSDYSMNKLKLTRKDNIKDLRILFDSKLSFNSHVEYIRNKSYLHEIKTSKIFIL